MIWFIPVALQMLLLGVISPILIKTASAATGRMKRFALQYLFAGGIMFLVLLAVGYTSGIELTLAVCLGLANGFAAYSQWRAVDLSLSKTALFSWGAAALAITLGYVFLEERILLNPLLAFGLLLISVSTVLLGIRTYRAKKALETAGGANVYFWIAAYTLIWGIIGFSERLFALQEVEATTFLGGWYLGSCVVGLVLFAGMRLRAPDAHAAFTVQDVLISGCLALVIMTGLGLEYWAYHYVPLAIGQPLFLMSGSIGSALIGLFYFREGEEYDTWAWGLYALGMIGALLLIIGFAQIELS